MQCVTFIIWGCSVDVWYAIGIHGTRSKKICFGQTDKNLAIQRNKTMLTAISQV
jgi:hypothetical protein